MAGDHLVGVFPRFWDAECVRVLVGAAHQNMQIQHVLLQKANQEIAELREELEDLTNSGLI